MTGRYKYVELGDASLSMEIEVEYTITRNVPRSFIQFLFNRPAKQEKETLVRYVREDCVKFTTHYTCQGDGL